MRLIFGVIFEKFRAELRAVPQLQRISFLFADNEMASWSQNGEALDLLDTGSEDLTRIMDLFSRVSATSARFYLPVSLKPGETPGYNPTQLLYTCAMTMGRIPIVEDTYSEEEKGEARSQDLCDDYAEMILQRKGAEIARDKLDVMTRQGREPLTPQGWYDFIDVWSPHFETLWPKFRGKQHYVEDDPWEVHTMWKTIYRNP